MTDGELATALVDWARGEITEIVATYDHKPKRHTQGWPEVDVFFTRRTLTTAVPGVGQAEQQTMFDLRSANVLIALKPEPVAQSIAVLRGFADRLLAALRRDRTLGGRVPICSPLADVDYDPGEIVFDDGTEAMGFTLNLSVAERIPAP
jgi:hypothetical protein